MTKHDRFVFGRYAYPCMIGKLGTRKITINEFREFEAVVLGGGSPSEQILRQYFPRGFNQFEADLGSMSAEESWRRHQGFGDNCAVKIATVVAIDALGGMVLSDEKTFHATNFYKFSLSVEETVTVHHKCIIEVL